MMEKKALMILADGVEELEATAPADVLRRAGVSLTLASLGENLHITGRNDLHLVAEVSLDTALAVGGYDAIILPGGPGHKAVRADARVIQLLRAHAAQDKLIGAICAATTVLHEAGLLQGKRYTAHFTVADELPNLIADAAVVEDGNLITSRGAGTALEFGLTLVARLCGQAMADRVAEDIHYRVGEAASA